MCLLTWRSTSKSVGLGKTKNNYRYTQTMSGNHTLPGDLLQNTNSTSSRHSKHSATSSSSESSVPVQGNSGVPVRFGLVPSRAGFVPGNNGELRCGLSARQVVLHNVPLSCPPPLSCPLPPVRCGDRITVSQTMGAIQATPSDYRDSWAY